MQAKLTSADLRNANLISADLISANLIRARYTAQTKLPDGFNPKEHDMIELDEDENQV